MGTKQIIHGVGQLVLKDFYDHSKFIALTEMTDALIESSMTYDDITGGNGLFTIAQFLKELSIKLTASNVSFDADILRYSDGAEKTMGVKKFPVIMSFAIPEDGLVDLEYVPSGDVYVKGFEKVEKADGKPAVGEFIVDNATKKLTFNAADKFKLAQVVYDRDSSEACEEYAVKETLKQTPFFAQYTFIIRDEDGNKIADCLIEIYKLQMTSGFSLDTKHQTAYTPKFEATAKDPNRPDKKLWALYIDGKKVD